MNGAADGGGVDSLDIGFELNQGDPGPPKNVNLTYGLQESAEAESQAVAEPVLSDTEMPNLLKYLQPLEDNSHQTEDPVIANSEVDCPVCTAAECTASSNTQLLVPDFSSALVGDSSQSNHALNDQEAAPILDAAPDGSSERSESPVEESALALADLLSAAVDEYEMKESKEANQVSITHEAQHGSEPAIEQNQTSAEENQAAFEVASTVAGHINISSGLEQAEVCNVEPQSDPASSLIPPAELASNSSERFEEINREPAATTALVDGVKDMTAQPEEEVDLEEPVAVSTIKTVDDDDDEFEFDIPTKQESQYDVSGVKADIQTLDQRMSSLRVYEEGRYSAEPLESLQVEVQKTLSDCQSCLSQCQELQLSIEKVPKQHTELPSLQSWASTAESRLQEIKRLAEIKHRIVQERTSEAQASLAVLEQANGSASVASDSLRAATTEWDAVQTIVPDIDLDEGPFSKAKKPVPQKGSDLVHYSEVMQVAERDYNLAQYKPTIKVSVPRKGFGGFIHRLFGTKLHKSLQDERDRGFCLAAYPYSDDQPLHWSVLLTIYRRLTGAQIDCPRFGSHWEQIGFQGNDPSTDLRGCGFLGLLQLLHLVSDPAVFILVKDIYRLSLHETQNFPFCIMGINLTRITLHSLREDNLNKECNKRKSVLGVMNDLYAGCWLYVYNVWKTQHKTIADTGFVMKDVENAAKKSPHSLIAALNTYLIQHQSEVKGQGEGMTFKAVSDYD